MSSDIYSLDAYAFNLPDELIAKYPAEPRDTSRLLVVDKTSGELKDYQFKDILGYLDRGDTLVINETKVIPARLYGFKDTGGKVEILLLKKAGEYWEAIVRPAKRLKKDTIVRFPNTDSYLSIKEELEMAGGRLVKLENCSDENEFIDKVGQMPLPPYIDRPIDPTDKDNYQTVFAKEIGSAAAPTAGLHFTEPFLEKINSKGVNIAKVVLHVGLGTFRPVSNSDIRQHKMHTESYYMSNETAILLNKTKKEDKKIVAVGTTVVRTLETIYGNYNEFRASVGETDIFIYPGYDFKAIDKLITNFHLPYSSLIMLVSALAGRNNIINAYEHAIINKYRFFSYGDAMLIK
ncbi:MAG TPA: tRNA preQ1(34) S-adenosylmethionine ribosyltransferase-isomerase QueA [Syntrophomonadaceae bacterium]|nr:tRNA preQ1(34) S-adenosylmethionine ribosyltransferase-isomerase QueA [Syntrophomonadaceae bacterium]